MLGWWYGDVIPQATHSLQWLPTDVAIAELDEMFGLREPGLPY